MLGLGVNIIPRLIIKLEGLTMHMLIATFSQQLSMQYLLGAQSFGTRYRHIFAQLRASDVLKDHLGNNFLTNINMIVLFSL